MKIPSPFIQKQLLAVNAGHIIDILDEKHHNTTPILEKVGLHREQLHDPTARVSLLQMIEMMEMGVEVYGEKGLGIEVGMRTRPTSTGPLSFAMMTSDTVHDAIALAVRLQNMYVHELQLEFNVKDGWANLELRRGYFLGKARPYFVEWLMFSIVQADSLFGIGAGPTEIWFDYPEPDYMSHYRQLTAVPIRYNMPHNLLRFPAELLDKPIPTADPIARGHAIKVCEEEIRRHAEETDDILARVRALLVISNDNGYPDADTVARKLNVSGRTLSRKLKEYSTGFRELLEQSRQRDAALLLQDPLLEIRDVAERLGYENPANFTRAFFKWNGMPPTHWRAKKMRNMSS